MHTTELPSERHSLVETPTWRLIGPEYVGSFALERAAATLAIFLVGLRSQWHFGLTTGYVAAIVLLPLTLPSLASFRWSKLLVIGSGVCVAYGLLISSWTATDHVISAEAQRQSISLVVGITVSTVLVLWARTMMPAGAIAIAFGVGGVLGADGGSSFGEAWKFQYSVPVTLVVLGIAALWRRTKVTVLLLCALAAVTIFADARSLFTTYLVTGGLLMCPRLLRGRSPKKIGVSRIAVVLAILFVVYKLADALIMSGLLGSAARERSIQNVESTGSTLLGGRPELSSTGALMRDHLAGYGLGAIPNTHDVAVGNAALERIGLQPTQDGFSTYMFGRQQYELHSVFGDLWALFGIAGLLVAGLLAIVVLVTLSSAVSGRHMSALILFLACATGWNIVSSPLWDSTVTMILLLGLTFPPARRSAQNLNGEQATSPASTQRGRETLRRCPS